MYLVPFVAHSSASTRVYGFAAITWPGGLSNSSFSDERR